MLGGVHGKGPIGEVECRPDRMKMFPGPLRNVLPPGLPPHNRGNLRNLRTPSGRAARARRPETRGPAQELPAPQTPTATSVGHSSTSNSDPWTVPASVRDRFTQEGHRFYFPDGATAFRDHGRRLSTPSENAELIRSLVEIAKARGWDTVVVQGTDRFREEAWRQARLEGLAVRGYRPSEPERAALSRALARRQAAPDEPLPSRAQGPGDAVADQPGPMKSADDRRSVVIAGKLVDHGRDTYHFDPHEEMSYFIRIQTPEGKRTFWGKDLQRAMDQSLTQPKIGEEVALKLTGRDNVTVKRRERDTEGTVLKESELDTHRNRWVIEKREFSRSGKRQPRCCEILLSNPRQRWPHIQSLPDRTFIFMLPRSRPQLCAIRKIRRSSSRWCERPWRRPLSGVTRYYRFDCATASMLKVQIERHGSEKPRFEPDLK